MTSVSRASAAADSPGTPAADFGSRVELREQAGSVPLFVTARDPALATDLDAFVAWFRDSEVLFDRALERHGAVVLRGFPVADTAAFGRMVEHYPDMKFGYSAGATERNAIEGRIYEATRTAADFKLNLHQEMAYLPEFPSKLAFWCRLPSETGGETIIGGMRGVTRRVPEQLREKVRAHGVRYVRNYRAPGKSIGHPLIDAQHRTWEEAFYTNDPAKVDADCLKMGLEREWQPDGSLSIIVRLPGVRQHPQTGEEVWFNQIHNQNLTPQTCGATRYKLLQTFYQNGKPLPFACTYGNSEPFDVADLDLLYQIFDEATVAFPWQAGDVMLVDNILCAHGRNPYGGARDVQVALIGWPDKG